MENRCIPKQKETVKSKAMKRIILSGIIILNIIAQINAQDCPCCYLDITNQLFDKYVKLELSLSSKLYTGEITGPEFDVKFADLKKRYNDEYNNMQKRIADCEKNTKEKADHQRIIESNSKAREKQKKEQDERFQRNIESQRLLREAQRKRWEAHLEAQQKEREKRINDIARPAQQNIDNFTGSAINAAYASEARGQELAGKNLLTEYDAQSQGRNISLTTQMQSEFALAMMKEESTTTIGTYENQPVTKKGDTIFVQANNKKYLLSKQPLIGKGDGIYGFIPANAFIITNDLQGNEMPIGYITTTTEKSNSTLYGENERFAKSAVGCKFTEFICDRVTYDKFIRFCDWEICRMGNTTNVNRLNYAEYDNIIKEDIALNKRILNAKLSDILVQLVGDFTSDKLAESFVGFDLNTSLQDWTLKTMWNEADQLQKVTGVPGDCFSSMAGVISSFKKESNPVLENTLSDFMKSNSKEQDLYTTETYRAFKRIWVSALDAVGECDKSGSIKKNILYHLLKNAPSAGETIGLYAANVSIKFSIAPEFKRNIEELIESSRKKKQFIENYKKQYSNLVNQNADNCLAYTQIINQLRSEVFNPFGEPHEQEVLAKIKDYVFGEKEIPTCKILSIEELKPTTKNIQQKPSSNNNKITDNYIAIALLDPNGANGLGHAGLILGDFSKGFLYYSHAPSNSPKLSKGLNYLDCKTVIAEINKYNNYSEAFYIPITAEIFKTMNESASKSVNREYKVHALAKDSNMIFSAKEVISLQPIADKMVMGSASNNCLDLLIDALKAGGFDIGTIEARNSIDLPVPSIRFKQLQSRNSGIVFNANQLCDFAVGANDKNSTQTEKSFSIPKRNH